MARETCKVIAITHLTLDGVYQAPARADEDTRDGFPHGGWAAAGDDPKLRDVIGTYMRGGWSLLAGRATYEGLYEGWVVRQPTSPMTQALTSVQKFVVSRSGDCRLPWRNSTLLAGDATETVAGLKAEHDRPLIVFGSGAVVRSIMRCGLVDEFVLMIHPLMLGQGRRFFDGTTAFTALERMETVVAESGVVVAVYRRV